MKRRLLLAMLLVMAVGAAAWFVHRHLTLDELIAREDQLRTWTDQHTALALVVTLVLYVVVSFVPGTAGKALVCGWLFGVWWGVLIVNLALTTTAVVTFWLGRYLFRDAIRSRWGPHLAGIDQALTRDGAFYLFALRVLHSPYTITNYLLGTTSIRTRDFWWATQLGMLPSNVIFVYAGAQLPTLRQISGDGISGIFTPGLIAAFVALSVLPLLLRSVFRSWHPTMEVADVEPRRGSTT